MFAPFWPLTGCALLALACTDTTVLTPIPTTADAIAAEQDAGSSVATSSPPSSLSFSLDGFQSENGASANISIREDAGVWLDVAGGLSGNGYITMRLILVDVETLFGEHTATLQLPGDPQVVTPAGDPGGSNASAYLDGQDYYSQAGSAEFEVDQEGGVTGSFSISLAPLAPVAAGELAEFTSVDEPRVVSGQFDGSWNINCYSRIVAHPTWVPGGAYCRSIGL